MAFSVGAVTNEQEPGETFRDIRGANGKLLFRIQTDCLERLEGLVREGIQPDAQQSTEIGGLVIGRKPAAVDTVEKLADFVAVGIKHPFGPVYRPGVGDRHAFEEALSRYPPEGESVPVGYFRSHFGESEIRDEDRWLMQRLFGNGGGLLVLIHAGTFRWSVLHIYRRTGKGEFLKLQEVPIAEILQTSAPFAGAREIRPAPEGSSQVETPLPAGLAPSEPSPRESSPRESPPREAWPQERPPRERPTQRLRMKELADSDFMEPADFPPDSSDEPAEGGMGPRAQRVLIAVGALILLAAAFAAGRYTSGLMRAATLSVGLNVEPHGSGVELRWNAASPVVKNAVHASLVIVDSDDADRVDLSSVQLATGRYEYMPRGANLTFQIMFHQRDDSFAGETRIYHFNRAGVPPVSDTFPDTVPGRSPPVTRAATMVVPVTEGAAQPFGQPAPVSQPPVSQVSPSRAATQPAPEPGTQTAPPRAFVPPAVRRTPAVTPPSIGIESPPQLGAEARRYDSVPANLVIPPPQPSPAPQSVPQPPAVSRSEVTPPRSPVITPPAILRQVMPGTPIDVRAMIQGHVTTIAVTVDISSQGKVTNARTTDDKGPIEKILAAEALRSARRWEFKPATRDGVPVSAQMVIQFQFGK